MRTYLSDIEIDALVDVIKTSEEHSTGEIRVHIDSSKNEEGDIAEEAFEVFKALEMHNTKDRNAVLFHINFSQRYLTIIGDEGIHAKVCQSFWDKIHDEMTAKFAQNQYFEGIKDGVLKTGIELKKYFPIQNGDNPNELANEITFS